MKDPVTMKDSATMEASLRLRALFKPLVALSDQAWQAAQAMMNCRHWRNGDWVLHAGDRSHQVHFLVEGCACYRYNTPDGKERIKSIIKPGGVLTSMSTLILQQPSPFDILMLRDSTTVSFNYADLLQLGENYSEWSLLHRKLLEQLALKKEKREASFLLLSAQDRYEEFLTDFGDLAPQIPLNKIALYLGITDVALSRIRKQMGLTRVKPE